MYCLDFLLRMQENLVELSISCKSGRLEIGSYDYSDFSLTNNSSIEFIESSQIIKFLGYQEKMLESNIWNLFPKLRKICLIIFSRADMKFESENRMEM